MGVLAIPAAFVLFRRLPDRGFTLAMPAAMVFFSYILWVLGLTHIAPNTQITVVIILVLAAIPSALLARRKRKSSLICDASALMQDFKRSHTQIKSNQD